jgi:CHRD domain
VGSKRVAFTLALVAGLLLASVAGAEASTPVRATLVSPEQPRAAGLFVGSLKGRTLTWRLTFDGLNGTPTGHLHLRAGAIAARLCAPCTSGVSGRTALSATEAAAVRARTAYVDVHAIGGAARGQIALGTVPSLQLLGLGDGAVVHLPAQVRFAVTGFRVSPGAGGIVLLTPGKEYRLQLGTGLFTLPDDKLLTGKRDLSFVLVRSDGTRLANSEARVTVYDVLLAGRR